MDRQAQIKADLEAYRASKQSTSPVGATLTTQPTIPKTGDIKTDLENYRASKQGAVSPIPEQPKENNMLQKFFVNTIGRPAIRASELVVGAGVNQLGTPEQKQRYEEAISQPTKLPLGLGTVDPQKKFGEGGGRQIAIETGKSALDIATAGLGGAVNTGIKTGIKKALPKLATSKLGRGAISTTANVTEGLGYQAGYNVLNEKPVTEGFGTAGVLSAVLPPAITGTIKALAPKTAKEYVAKVLKNTGSRKLSEISSGGKELDKAVGGFNTIRENAKNIIVKDIDDVEKVFDPQKATFFELPQALQQTKQAIYKQYSDIAREAGERGVDFSQAEFDQLNNILEKYQGKGYTPAFASKARQFQEALNKFDNYATPEELQAFIEKVNLDVNPLSDKAGSQVANEFSQEIRRLLDDKLEKSGNPLYQATRDKYAELKSIEKDIIARYKEALRKTNANPGLIDGISTIDGIMGVVRGDPTQVLRAGLIQTVKRGFTYLKDPERALQNAFKALEGYQSKPLPGIQAKANTKNTIAKNIIIPKDIPNNINKVKSSTVDKAKLIKKVNVLGKDVPLPEDLSMERLRLDIEGESIKNNPLNQLWKYADKRNDVLPEVTGGGKSIFSRKGDDIVNSGEFKRFADENGMILSEDVREAFADFVQKKREYKENLKSVNDKIKNYINQAKDEIALDRIAQENLKREGGFIKTKTALRGAGISTIGLGGLSIAKKIKERKEKNTPETPKTNQELKVYKKMPDGSRVYELPSGTKVSEMHTDIRDSIDKAYKAYPELPKGVLEAILMKESSAGYDNSQKNDKIGKYAWLGGLTQIAKEELERNGYKPDFDTIGGAINSIAKFYSLKQKGNNPLVVYRDEYSSGKLSKEALDKFEDMYNYYSNLK